MLPRKDPAEQSVGVVVATPQYSPAGQGRQSLEASAPAVAR